MALKDRDVSKALLRKGFVESNSNHKFYTFYFEGRKQGIFTKLSHNRQDIGDYLIKCMAKDIYLSKSQFLEFVSCNISESQYIDIQIQKGNLVR